MPNDLTVPRERVAAIIERELPKYRGTFSRKGWGHMNHESEGNEVNNMAEEIARTTGRPAPVVARRLYAIRSGNTPNKSGGQCPGNPTVHTVDWILTGLGLPHLWHTELADVYEQI